MKTNFWWRVWLGLLLAALLFPAGCASPEGGYQESEYGQSYNSAVPPSYYGDDSTLEYWYTPPYWHPDAD